MSFSDNFTKAKVTVVGKMMMFMGMGAPQLMDVPFPSYWKSKAANGAGISTTIRIG